MATKRLQFDKRKIPIEFYLTSDGVKYKFKLRYNKARNSLYLDLYLDDDTIVSEKITYGVPLFSSLTDYRKPNLTLIAYDISNSAEIVTYQNLNDSVYIYVVRRETVEAGRKS